MPQHERQSLLTKLRSVKESTEEEDDKDKENLPLRSTTKRARLKCGDKEKEEEDGFTHLPLGVIPQHEHQKTLTKLKSVKESTEEEDNKDKENVPLRSTTKRARLKCGDKEEEKEDCYSGKEDKD
jgi:hypothetical protein